MQKLTTQDIDNFYNEGKSPEQIGNNGDFAKFSTFYDKDQSVVSRIMQKLTSQDLHTFYNEGKKSSQIGNKLTRQEISKSAPENFTEAIDSGRAKEKAAKKAVEVRQAGLVSMRGRMDLRKSMFIVG